MKLSRQPALLSILTVAITVGLPAQRSIGGQAEESASDLIKFLTYQSGRPDTRGVMRGVFTCGAARAEDRENAAVTEKLVHMGDSALLPIDEALDAIRRSGRYSEFAVNAEWLLQAYARIKGRSAYDDLRKMAANPKLGFLQRAIDNALALSLGVTSYLSDSRDVALAPACIPVRSPESMLSQFVLAWEKDAPQALEEALGPEAQAALNQLRNSTKWRGMRSAISSVKQPANMAVGYRFITQGWWSVPWDGQSDINLSKLIPANPLIETQFTDRRGRACGTYRVQFLRTETNRLMYVVNNGDITDLLYLVSACAVRL